jgi:DNA helicase-4
MIFNRYTTYRPGLLARLLPSGRWKLRIPTLTTGSVELHTGTRAELRCLDITAIGIKKALLWHTVELRTRSHVETLSCLGEEVASRLANDLHRFINRHLPVLIGSDQEALKKVDAKLDPLPHRHERTEPSFIRNTIDVLATAKKVSVGGHHRPGARQLPRGLCQDKAVVTRRPKAPGTGACPWRHINGPGYGRAACRMPN